MKKDNTKNINVENAGGAAESKPESTESTRKNDTHKNIYEMISDDIAGSDIEEAEKNRMLSRLIHLRNEKVNLLVVGATGVGKSSTINAMFNMEVAKVGVDVEPETNRLSSYNLENLTIWDTPGLGDGKSDKEYNRQILNKLNELDDNGDPLIDLVLVVLDASSKDLGTSYNLINNVIIPCLGKGATDRILIGLNQADMAMKGKHWDDEANEPDEVLKDYLDKKAASVKKRIYETTGVRVSPICYCAGYKEDNGEQRRPYNLTKLLYYIVTAIPKEKRLVIADNINSEKEMWECGDKNEKYKKNTSDSFLEAISDCIFDSACEACVHGLCILGVPGAAIGFLVGGIWGAISGVVKTLIDF